VAVTGSPIVHASSISVPDALPPAVVIISCAYEIVEEKINIKIISRFFIISIV
jgi:hypothetical protein